MAVRLSEDTEKLIEEMLPESGVANADQLVQLAIRLLPKKSSHSFNDLDAETRASIAEGLADIAAGKVRPWEDVREELRSRFIK